MKKLFIVANWKSNKTTGEAVKWLQDIEKLHHTFTNEEKEVIVCPSFISLPSMKAYASQNNLSINIGAQDISPFAEGAHTGEISGGQIKEVGEYVIIGHSERRKDFSENDFLIEDKAKKVFESDLVPILCVQGIDTPIPQGVPIVAYEPIFAIGSGHPDTPDHADSIAAEIKSKHPFVEFVLYGGSVTPEDVNSFTSTQSVDGVLVGGASLDAVKFAQIIKNA